MNKNYYVTVNIEFKYSLPDCNTTEEQDLAFITRAVERGKLPKDLLVSDINIVRE